ncbi:MAG: adenylosuccinate synthase [Candidatus Woesearchaeota archaeon]
MWFPIKISAKYISRTYIAWNAYLEVRKIPAVNVIGIQWGDEGKGKIVDAISEDADMVVRYQGGNNAGHTIVIGKKTFSTHCLPSGVSRKKRCLIASEVVLDPRQLKKEIGNLGFEPDLGIDPRTHIIFPYHNALDLAREKARGGDPIGTTLKGIGPCYEDAANRTGIRSFELVKGGKSLEKRIKENFRFKKRMLKHLYNTDVKIIVDKKEVRVREKDVVEQYVEFGKELKKYLSDISMEVNSAMKKNKNVLFEGAQGTLLDISHGNYPKVTSSHPMAGAIFTSVGMPPQKIHTIGIAKAYVTKVGSGPVVTCLDHGKWPVDESVSEQEANYIRERGQEAGTTTMRLRRVGWQDLVALKYTVGINGVDEIALTKIDVLEGLEEIKVAVAYMNSGYEKGYYPAWDTKALENTLPLYQTLPGFKKTLEDGELSPNAQALVDLIEDKIQVPIRMVSYGPERSEILHRYKEAVLYWK